MARHSNRVWIKRLRFNIVVTNYPDRGDTLFVKRLVGLPGDTVELKEGYLYINGIKYDEPYIQDEYRKGAFNTLGPVVVPEGCYFVIGDHRNNSNDSRSVGSLPADLMVGVVTAIDGKPVNNPEVTAKELSQLSISNYVPYQFGNKNGI